MRVLSWVMSLAMAAGGNVQPIGVGPVEYSGDVPEYFQREIERTLGDAIERTHGVAVGLRVESCTQLKCLLEPAARSQLAVVLMPRVTQKNRDYHVEIVAYAVDDGAELARVEADCSVCGQQELLDAIPAEVVELHAKLAAIPTAQDEAPRLAVDGEPKGAMLTLDGEDLGASPVALDVATGEHQLEIVAPGHHSQVHRWIAGPGVEEVVSYELTPRHAAGKEGRGLVAGGWLGIALGLAGTGTGVAFLVLNGREHGPTCDSALVDVNGACPNVYTTATAGYVSLGLGLAAIGLGAGLLIHSRRRGSTDARIRVTTAGVNLRF